MRGSAIRILLCWTALTAFAVSPLRAQLRLVPRTKPDSLAHPATAPGAEAMRFERTAIDAGRIAEEQNPPSFTFRWTNAGRQPLVVTQVSTTCGCAVATFDRQPVKPGEDAEVTVTYHPKGHPGSFSRRIFVYTQLSAKYPTAILDLTGTVEATAQSAAGYPVSMGALQLSRKVVRFDGNGSDQQALVACRNVGSRSLRIGGDTHLMPAGFEFECTPAVLEPGAEGTITVRFEPSAATRKPQRALLRLTGLDLPPSKSSLHILIETE